MVAGAGDVNGDGYADVIVGAKGNDAGGSDAGRAYVFFGGPGADAVADWTLTGLATGDNFGWSVAGAGDVNGDGYADVIVGAPLNDSPVSNAGRASVYFGGPTRDGNADLSITGSAVSDWVGFSVAGAGDVNRDGFADVIVGAPKNDAAGADAGRALVLFGSRVPDVTPDLIVNGAAAGDQLGTAVASAGDVNGDGYADVIVGAPYNDVAGADAGQSYVFYGSPAPDAVADLNLTGNAAGDNSGTAVASAGDVNGDSFADVVVGAPYSDAGAVDAGRTSVFFGGASADATADLVFAGALYDNFGIAVASAGDVNGDGRADIVIGSAQSSATGDYGGRVYVYSAYPFEVLSPNGGEQWVAGRSATVRWRGHDAADVAVSPDGGATWNTVAAGVGGAEDNTIQVVAPGTLTTTALVRVTYTGNTAKRSTSDASRGAFAIVAPTRAPAVTTSLAQTTTGAVGDNLGYAVASAGDVNGDGYADVMIGAPRNDAVDADAGRAYVYFGGPASDTLADLVLSGASAGDYFGAAAASAGDVNGDGYDDVIVGAPNNDTAAPNAGRAYVYFGGLTPDPIADMIVTGVGSGDLFGTAVASAGDVNGDGYDDVLVGALLNDAGGADAGRAYLYFGGRTVDTTADLLVTGVTGEVLGCAVSSAGDVNGDGFADMLIGAYGSMIGNLPAGRAYVYFGGATPNAVADLTLTGSSLDTYFGTSVASAGDVDGDGFDDMIVGALGPGLAGTGRAYVFLGGPGADARADLTLDAAAAADLFGNSVASAGDVNADGFADVIVGAPGNDAGGAEAGRAYVYYGGRGADAQPDIVLTGAAAFDSYGWSVASAGDVDGDGFDDLIVGAWGNSGGAGRAYVYADARYHVVGPNDGEIWNVGAAQTIRWRGAEPADLWLSTDGGANYAPLLSDVGGAEFNSVQVLVPHTPTKFARIKVTTHDASVKGADASDSLFTIQSSVALLNFAVTLGDGGATLTWGSEPGVGPSGLAGYRVYRAADATDLGTRIGPDLIAETRYVDPQGAPGTTYRLTAVNGLQEELELGRVSTVPAAPLAAWPQPYRGGALTVSFGVSSAFDAEAGEATVQVFDLAGRKVATLARGSFARGFHTVRWDGRDDRGAEVGSGLYIVRATSAGARHGTRLVVVR